MWGTVAKVGAGVAWKGAQWGYGKWKASRAQKACVRDILEASPRLSEREQAVLLCAAKRICKTPALDMKSAKAVCRGR